MMDSTKDHTLRQRIRQAILGGRLPGQAPARTWGGCGTGAVCAICGEQITSDQLEYELEYARASSGNGRAAGLHVHVECCAAWESERKALGLSQAQS